MDRAHTKRPIRLRSAGSRKYPVWTLTIPSYMGRELPQGSLFEAELTDEGILFRFLGIETDVEAVDAASLPAWARNGKATQ